MKVLALDDDQTRLQKIKFLLNGNDLTCVTTAQDAIEELKSKDWDLVLLDHDLGGQIYVDSSEKNTGMEVCRYLSANPGRLPKSIILHSWNHSARANMYSMLETTARALGINMVIRQEPFMNSIYWADLEHGSS